MQIVQHINACALAQPVFSAIMASDDVDIILGRLVHRLEVSDHVKRALRAKENLERSLLVQERLQPATGGTEDRSTLYQTANTFRLSDALNCFDQQG